MRWFASAQLRTYPVRCQGFDTAKNPKLHAVFPSGAVPDLRGKFIRGWAHGSTTDPDSGRTIGSDQDHGIPDHAHWAGIESYSRFDISHHRQETVREGKIRQYVARTGQISQSLLHQQLISRRKPGQRIWR
ncbi:hypothetical protein ACFFW8_14710 [Erwinia tracheiphila]